METPRRHDDSNDGRNMLFPGPSFFFIPNSVFYKQFPNFVSTKQKAWQEYISEFYCYSCVYVPHTSNYTVLFIRSMERFIKNITKSFKSN